MLTYITCGLNSGSASNVKTAVLGHFTSAEIAEAKDALFIAHLADVIGEKKKRVSTAARSNTEANMDDIITAIQQLDNSERMPTIAVKAMELGKIPKSNAEELNNISLVDRLNKFEDTIDTLRNLLEKSVLENAAMRDDSKKLKAYKCVQEDKTLNNIPSSGKRHLQYNKQLVVDFSTKGTTNVNPFHSIQS